MKEIIQEINFLSSNNRNIIRAKLITPKDRNIIGIVQIVHGMCEYFDKYENFTNYLVNNGFAVCGHDQIGHGSSINSKEDRGYFASKDGYKFLIEDAKRVTDIIKDMLPDIPYYLFGHSMGSLVSRCYCAKYGDKIDGVILCGTVGPQPFAQAGIKLARFMITAKGDHYRSRKLYNLALDFANVKFIPVKTRYDWICSNPEEVKKHMEDEKSNFIFTVSGFSDLFHLVSICNSEMVVKSIPKKLPILFISGEQDPIGENGFGVRKAVKLYRDVGLENVKCKLYESDRHELVNETDKENIYNDILLWINKASIDGCE